MSMKFGIILTPRSGAEWVDSTRAAEQQGYQTILLPDTLFTPSPFPALAAAAGVTGTVRLRPNVLAAPLRHPTALAREVAALQLLSDGRFELGIGAGRPDAAQDAARLGVPWRSARRRREQLLAAIEAVRAAVYPVPQIVVAASGPLSLAAAAPVADRILLAAMPDAPEEELATMVRIVRDHTDRDIRFTHQLVGIGEQLPYWTEHKLGLTAAGLRAAGAAGLLDTDLTAATEVLDFRRAHYGIDELIVPGELAESFAPVLAHYTGASA